jgi:hypothetical protein
MATKGARGEAVLEMDGQSYSILFTNRAIAEAEQRTGKAFLHMLRCATTGDLGVNDVANLLVTGLEAARRETGGGKPYQITKAFELMDAVGFTQAAAAVVSALSDVLTFSSQKDEGEESSPPE